MRYYIRQLNSHVSGPFEVESILQWIKQRKVRPEMEFSEDGDDWAWGYELLELFPPDHKSRRRSRERRAG